MSTGVVTSRPCCSDLVGFSTASSESVYPKLMEQLEKFGIKTRVTGFVLPLGYSFNLDGSMMYTTFLALFIAPVILLVPAAATAPALIVVGFLMMEAVLKIDMGDLTEGIPAFVTIIMMPLTYSIAEGIIFGVICYVLVKALSGKNKDIQMATWLIAAIFFAKFVWLSH